MQLISFEARAKGISLDVDISDGLSPIQMHEDDLHLILINPIINAFEAMPDGGTLTITAKPGQSGGNCLRVSDTGIGMEPEVLSQAIYPLFTTKHDTSGMGLGLSMCSDLIHATGAQLNLSSTPDMGTTVVVDFPDMVNRDRKSLDLG